MPKVLIADYVDFLLLDGLLCLGMEVVYAPEISRTDLVASISSFDGLIVNTRMRLGREEFEMAKSLTFVARLGVGLDIFDLTAARACNVQIFNCPGANANAVAEHMFGILLNLLRHINPANAQVRRGQWLREWNRGVELQGKTIGIIGFGNTGSALARKFAGWMTEILTYDKYKTHYATDHRFITETDLNTLLVQSDVISLHVPLTDETHHMVNDQLLVRCKPGVVLLNGSRGKVVHTKSLLHALDLGLVSAAGLDVLENEKLNTMSQQERADFTNLAGRDNVIITPHIAGWTEESKVNIAQSVLDSVSKMYNG